MRMYSFVSALALALMPGTVLAQTARPVAPAGMTPATTAPVPQPDIPPTAEPDSTAVPAPSVQVTAPMSAQISASMSGQLEKFPLRDGDHFHKGDVLAEFRCGQQKATLAHAHAEYIKRRGLLDVQNKMKALGQWSVSDLRSAAADERAANADLEMASAVVAQCVIEAPFDGRVSNTMVHNYQYLSAGTPMLEILDDTSLELSMIVSSMELRHLQPGTSFKVHILETDAIYPATISRISGKVDPVSKTIKVYGKLTRPAPDLLPGMTGEAQFGQ